MNITKVKMQSHSNITELHEVIMGLCNNHLIAGLTFQKVNTVYWNGGSLRETESYVVEGYTKPELLGKINEIITPKETIVEKSTYDEGSEYFNEWMRMHL